jgi:hypothetical protein
MPVKLKIWGILLLLFWSGNRAYAAGNASVIPYNGILTYPSEKNQTLSSIPIRSSAGAVLYDLSLEPDFDVGHHVVVLNLVLRGPADSSDSPNRFDPTSKAHGYQKYVFAASDFSNGIQKSMYGKKRTIELDSSGVEVQIDVQAATVSAVPATRGGEHQFVRLTLRVEVNNHAP